MTSLPTSFDITNSRQCRLFLNRYSLCGVVADYIIEFPLPETCLEDIIDKTYDLFHMLCEKYSDTRIKARLIAECEFLREKTVRDENGEQKVYNIIETYHFASYSAEWVEQISCMDFYERHMQKIASRMDDFNRKGSSLKLNRIKHIHIAITACNAAASAATPSSSSS